VVIAAGPEDRDLADRVGAGLQNLGFFVAPGEPAAGPVPRPARQLAIDEAADFVCVLSPAALGRLANPDDGLRAELAYAFSRQRVVVPVCLPGAVVPPEAHLAPELRRLTSVPAVRFDPTRERESVSRLAHCLSSDAEVEDRTLNRRARAGAWAVGLIALFVVLYFAVPPLFRIATAPRPKAAFPPFAVAWGGAVLRPADGGVSVVPVAGRLEVHDGDRLRIAFVPSADGHAYVVSRAPDGGIDMLFPGEAIRGASRVEAGRVYWAPADATGWEATAAVTPASIFIIAGYDPLENLEELAEDADSAGSSSARSELLASTLEGLIDGRHGTGGRPIRTRGGHPIAPWLSPASAPPGATLTFADGTRADLRLVPHTGSLSTAVEIQIERRSR